MAIPLNPESRLFSIHGPAGLLEVIQDTPHVLSEKNATNKAIQGCAVIAHPHPLHGGTMNNKVVHTLVKSFLELGYTVLRFNFRGVEGSAGAWGEGPGEIEDMKAVVQYAQQLPELVGRPVVLAGFSFGGYVASHVARWLTATQPHVLQGLVLVSPAVATFQMANVQAGTLLIHGAQDDVVLPQHVFQWAASQGLPVSVIPAAGHFFHGQLPLLKDVVSRYWHGIVQK